MKKVPVFFCENCGGTVRRDTKVCPHCGRFFASVRCPRCNYTGNADEFREGCPSCGYAFPQEKKIQKPKYRARKRGKESQDSLPFWIYFLVIALCCGLALAFIFYL
ncbi:double zinc ribbon domain-containing protein [Treponema phagedenis]|uniref:double zinc ribbon domain-containing protein n=1 Tax=Treponema phagedenis TaxID=162 RepID=UPI0001F641B3|nr:zinc ribbon domain-containing protein [Treponema phagedenis]EFW39430.1 hypothetical protein HMPREF9554_00041 [Treponema phagedenis F0421]TYT76615.1 zinc ribbon domain-containing protein [Treponema phagedenis]